MNQAEYVQTIIEMVRDQHTIIDEAARGRALQMALMRYGADAPLRSQAVLVWPVEGYAAPLPMDWAVSYRIDNLHLVHSGGLTPLGQYQVLETMTGFELVLSDRSLPAGATVRIDYTRPHDVASVAAGHQQAVCAYAAHLLFLQLAAYFSGERESTIGADHSNTESRARNYAARAKECRGMYFGTLGIADPQASAGVPTKAAAGVTAWPKRNPRHQLVQRHGI
jgi:hypothetical protein